MKKFTYLLLFVLVNLSFLQGFGQGATFNPFEPAKGFGLFVEKDMTVHGKETKTNFAVGGNLIMPNGASYKAGSNGVGTYTVAGDAYPTSAYIGGTMIASDYLNVNGKSFLKVGNMTGLTCNDDGNNLNLYSSGKKIAYTSSGENCNQVSVMGPLNIPAAFTTMRDFNACLATMADNVTMDSKGFINAKNAINFITLTPAQLSSDMKITTNADAGHVLVINVRGNGSAYTMNGNLDTHSDPSYSMINITNMPALIVERMNSNLHFSILAPNTDVTLDAGKEFRGQLVFKSFTQSDRQYIHPYNFIGQVTCSNTPPPPPPSGGNGEICFVSPTKPNDVNAKITWTYNSTNQTYTVRTTFSKGFVDNTYGTNAIGWGSKGHSFGNLVGSDHLQLALNDASGNKKLEFKLDYISTSASAPSGYKSLGVTGGEGDMIVGSESDVLGATTSLDQNLNTKGCVFLTNSPATDANYSPSPECPGWIYEVWYEVTVKASAFGPSGFGAPSIEGVHASPSKTGSNSEDVIPGPCPGILKLGNLIWNDENKDGLKQTAERGIGGLTVNLYKDANGDNVADGSAVTSTTTDANGFYYFSNLAEGKYIVGVIKSGGYGMSGTTANSSNPDSDFDNDNNGINESGNEIKTNFITLTKDGEPINDGDGNNGNLTLDIGLQKVSTPPNGGEICYASPTKGECVNARIQYTVNTTNNTVTLRTIFSKCFVDNTFGTNSIGWGSKGHTFGNLVGSDHVELSVFDANNTKKLQFKLDYISASNTAPSGYESLGVTGGEGKVILGNESDFLDAKSSLDANFNDYGYVLTTNSPATDANYSPNPTYPNWIYDVWYEVTFKASALGSAGLGKIFISSVHASPSKTGSNTEEVLEVPCPSILKLGDLVFKDLNDNGVRDAGEPGVSGVTVNLYRDANADNVVDGALIATTTTDANGNYYFSNLAAGNYIVGIVVPSGHTAAVTTATSANPNNDINNDNNGVNTAGGELRSNFVSLSPSTEPMNDGDGDNGNLTVDFGLKAVVVSTLNLGNLIWNDLNENGVKDGTEPGMGGLTVRLYRDANGDNVADGAAIATTITDGAGIYGFANLQEGKYIVGVVAPDGFIGTTAIASSLVPDNDVDDDNNGIVTVNNNEIQTRFITLTSNSEPINDGDGANGNLTLDIGLRICGNLTIGDYVWEDTNGNGLQGDDEYGISGVKVTLTKADGSIVITYTNADGYYYFNSLLPGTYTVTFETPAGYRPTVSNAGRDDRDSDPVNSSVSVTINTPPGDLTIDAGFVKVTLSLGNEVFNDLNENGVRDTGEPGIPGLKVNLYRDNNTDNVPDGLAIASTVTDANGLYNFTNLSAGSYIASVEADREVWINGPVPPSGVNPNNNIDKDNNGIITFNNEIFSFHITLSPGTEPSIDGDGIDGNLTLDFGLVVCPPDAASNYLGNRVFIDANGNGVLDNGETGFSGITVNLYDDINGDNIPDGPASQTTITSNDGSYGFLNLDDLNYIVGVVLPAGYQAGAVNATSATPNNDVDSDNNGIRTTGGEVFSNFITLLAGSEPTNDGDDNRGNLTLDFGLVPTANSTIGDYVWHDYNRNGIQDANEPGFAGVTVKLTKPGGSVLTVTTNQAGQYSFTNLPAGTYTVCFTTPIPTAYIPSPSNQGGDDTKDSDPVDGCVTVVLGTSDNNTTIDAGFYDDIDDDDDGITDLEESKGTDPFFDCDNDGIPNYKDQSSGCPEVVWSDCPLPGSANGDGINDYFDFDRDGIINSLDLDSDNDGILDVQEARDPRAVDVNLDGMVDGTDNDGDGLLNSADATPNVYGGPGLIPQDLDRDGRPNYLDLDSDGDGISDITEATGTFDNDGLANGVDSDGDGVKDIADGIAGPGAKGIGLADQDGDGKPNPFDIDSDNDGITDNIEGQPTCSTAIPTGNDMDGDGMDDAYDIDNNVCPPKAPGIRPYDKDGDGTPDIYDLDTDNDRALDVNEGSGIPGNFVTQFGDADGDGLIDQFDIFNIQTATSMFTHNVAHSEMGPNGNFDGPVPAGSAATLPKSYDGGCAEGTDRDWRDIRVLPVTLVSFNGNLNNGNINLGWVVANEVNMSHYIVERSLNGVSYSEVGTVKALGNSVNTTYTLSDKVTGLSATTLYYRLKQVDKGNTSKLSNVLTFRLVNRSANALAIHPNPARHFFTVKVAAQKDGNAVIRIMDLAGRVVMQQSNRVTTGSNAITFNNIGNIAAGSYNVQVMLNNEVMNEKLIIVK